MSKRVTMSIRAAMIAGSMVGAAHAGDSPVVVTESLSVELSQRMVAAALDDCTRRGFKVSVAAVNREGNLTAFLRHPLAGAHTILGSQQKAYAAASFQAPTSAMHGRDDLRFLPGVLIVTGGMPVAVAGQFYGGIAVAGAEPEVDELCAAAGIKAIAETLEFR